MSKHLAVGTFFGATPPTPMTPPTPQFSFPNPISYEFQVVEHVKDGVIGKVALQVRTNTHDQYGNITMTGSWEDVPRVRIGDVATVV